MSFSEEVNLGGGLRSEVNLGRQGVEMLRKRIGVLRLGSMLPMDNSILKLTIFQGCQDDAIRMSKVDASGRHILFGTLSMERACLRKWTITTDEEDDQISPIMAMPLGEVTTDD